MADLTALFGALVLPVLKASSDRAAYELRARRREEKKKYEYEFGPAWLHSPEFHALSETDPRAYDEFVSHHLDVSTERGFDLMLAYGPKSWLERRRGRIDREANFQALLAKMKMEDSTPLFVAVDVMPLPGQVTSERLP